ncbi:nucleotidyl transferase AbiEii/AbiGii toxin family protein [Umezawaea sp. Da 62-37]|uniref:nucleotidyl transferase AbiEii/AbiGii toxin family protein n=1 Tax=Umezawaea sp. Da 62-37 TaxID=3075927 RepID=UPI0028F6CF46|nr:nucleotidyl transferase AbiEii/AbiGii toxin family protein [Umezawaea sp. Da 62-37]WNV86698.1 nucleotidyl transferase AbiEii/AbiGii toxin family protein [Umezawaea sp. Da 62-37]WNV86719.1 nucleotidyl transferase AbiEii/AbiGii toxin family protein [Umezawaea sp. Da 62-37]
MITAPAEFRRRLNTAAKAHVRIHGGSVQDLMERFYLSRLLARAYSHDPQGWLLKGGQALLVRYTDARHSRDLDLLYRHADRDLDDAVTALRTAAVEDLGDHVCFEFFDTTSTSKIGHARRVRFTPIIGTKSSSVLGVDVVVGPAPFGEPVSRILTPVLAVEGIEAGPVVRLYPIVDHLADKICAMHERHSGVASSRYRDLVDILLMILREPIDGTQLRTALHTEVGRRRLRGTDITLPRRFRAPDPVWIPGYRDEARTVAGLERFRTWDEAFPFVCRFLDPLLADRPPGTWRPEAGDWRGQDGPEA